MLYKTHQAFGLFSTSLMLIDYTHTPIVSASGVLALGMSMVTAIMPDADHPNTTSAKVLFPLAMACELLRAKHRGVTHSLTVAALWFWLARSAVHWNVVIGTVHFSLYPVLLGAAVGYLSHIVLDLLNREGEQLLWPLRGRFALYLMESDGFANTAFEVVFLLGTFVVLLYGIALQTPALRQLFQLLHAHYPIIPLA